MKVCLLTRTTNLGSGGVGRVGKELYGGLKKRGVDITLITSSDIPYFNPYSYLIYTLMELPIRLLRIKADIYHALTPMEGMWSPGDKSIVTVLDLFMISDKDKIGATMGQSRLKAFIGSRYFEFVSGMALRKASGIACISEKTSNDLMQIFGLSSRTIRLGIRGDLEPKRERSRISRIGYLGQLDRRKRVDVLIKAFKKSEPGIELIIGGIGVDEAYLKSLAKGDGRIRFLGHIKDEELVDFYNSMDVLISPSWIEGYGLPIVEAMACKRPVVVLDDALIPWEIKKRCIIVQNLDMVLQNRTYLENLCTYSSYGSNYEWAKEHTWDKCIEEYIKLYKEIL
ncbi:MAG: glycosyltransferase [Proteobacteria bacterium]|nr:glycosyltransferase [Pseudomonadota bacterium]